MTRDRPERQESRTRACPSRAASIVALALTMIPLAGCECVSVVEADTGIPSDRPVTLRASWCDGKDDCVRSTLDSSAPATRSPEGFELSDRNGHWFVELHDAPPKRSDVVPATLEIREAFSDELVIRASANHQSDDGCVFISVAGPPRP
jgi:hypothetical protein